MLFMTKHDKDLRVLRVQRNGDRRLSAEVLPQRNAFERAQTEQTSSFRSSIDPIKIVSQMIEIHIGDIRSVDVDYRSSGH